MRILLTRPELDGQRLVETLLDNEFEAINHPFLTIKNVHFSSRSFQGADGYIFTSKNAVRSLNTDVIDTNLPAYVVGSATAKEAKEQGFTNVVEAEGDVQSLLTLLNDTTASLSLLYVRGEAVTYDLKTSITHHTINEVLTYKTDQVMQWSDALTRDFLSLKYTHIVFSSVRTIEAFIKSIEVHTKQENIKNALSRTTILFFGNPMLRYAEYLKANRYVVLPKANIQGLITTLEEEKRSYGEHI